MASITITVGQVTATKNAGDAAAANILADYVAAYGGPVNGTNQQKLDWIVTDLVRHIREVANGASVKAAKDAAEATAVQTASTRQWS